MVGPRQPTLYSTRFLKIGLFTFLGCVFYGMYLLSVIFYYDQSTNVACGGFVSLSMVNPEPAEGSPLFFNLMAPKIRYQ